jgi:hypothetical protein
MIGGMMVTIRRNTPRIVERGYMDLSTTSASTRSIGKADYDPEKQPHMEI